MQFASMPFAFNQEQPWAFYGPNHWQPWTSPMSMSPIHAQTQAHTQAELVAMQCRINALMSQMSILQETLRQISADLALRGYTTSPWSVYGHGSVGANSVTPMGGVANGGIPNSGWTNGFGTESSFCRLRENEGYLCCEIFVPGVSMNDIEVEVIGNRVACRTRCALTPIHRRQLLGSMPRGVECFELPDGRIEFAWSVPVPFQAKEVESTFRDGWIAIYVPRIESTQRQTVRMSKESSSINGRKGNNELNA